MQQRFNALTLQLGGVDAAVNLPAGVLGVALAHGDDILVVTAAEPDFEIDDLVLANGYTVFDVEGDELYNLDETDGLEDLAWGRMAEDYAWLLNSTPGEYIWVVYEVADGTERVLMVIRA